MTPTETKKDRPDWWHTMRRQGRNLSWLAEATGKTYPTVTAYAQGRTKAPDAWLALVRELLGEAS